MNQIKGSEAKTDEMWKSRRAAHVRGGPCARSRAVATLGARHSHSGVHPIEPRPKRAAHHQNIRHCAWPTAHTPSVSQHLPPASPVDAPTTPWPQTSPESRQSTAAPNMRNFSMRSRSTMRSAGTRTLLECLQQARFDMMQHNTRPRTQDRHSAH